MTWPTKDDAIATELSLEQDLMGPISHHHHHGDVENNNNHNHLAMDDDDLGGAFNLIPVGDDKSSLQDQPPHESLGQSPSARSSVQPLSDEEVVQLLEIHRLRLLIAEGVARCGPQSKNGTQYCSPTHAIVTRETS